MTNFQLRTPVVLIIFNRPEHTNRVFAEIARARPPRLFLVADGPRITHDGEEDLARETRAIIERVNWPCDVQTNFSEVNLGCRVRVSSGLDWVFEQVAEAIILEDDCLPNQTFFRFCEELLIRYRDDQRIGMISGGNYQFGHRLNDDSYYFSALNHVWGWASWSDRWKHDYDVNLKHWPKIRDEGRVADWFFEKAVQIDFSRCVEETYLGKIDTWDYQWVFASRLNGRIAAVPNVNLISNIGFGSNATHTKGEGVFSNLPTTEITFPLNHPLGIFSSNTLDSRFKAIESQKLGLSERVARRIIKTFRKLRKTSHSESQDDKIRM
jgi:hypothetical protein